MSQADEILKFKQLLDSGVITQEEFDSAKAKILNNTEAVTDNKEKKSSGKKTPLIIVTLVVFVILTVFCIAVSGIIPTSKQLTQGMSTSQEPADNTATTDATPLISVGDSISIDGVCDFTVDYVDITTDVKPKNPQQVYTHYEAENGKAYVDFCIAYTNRKSNDVTADKTISGTMSYAGQYTYSGFSIIEENDRGNFTYTNITSIAPLTTEYLHYLFEVPEEVMTSSEPIELKVRIGGNDYRVVVRGASESAPIESSNDSLIEDDKNVSNKDEKASSTETKTAGISESKTLELTDENLTNLEYSDLDIADIPLLIDFTEKDILGENADITFLEGISDQTPILVTNVTSDGMSGNLVIGFMNGTASIVGANYYFSDTDGTAIGDGYIKIRNLFNDMYGDPAVEYTPTSGDISAAQISADVIDGNTISEVWGDNKINASLDLIPGEDITLSVTVQTYKYYISQLK